MEFDVDIWTKELSEKILKTFEERVLFIGFQGSYKRGEAGPDSDIDMVVILDELHICDLEKYKDIVQSMSFREKACGFISGRKEISNWPKFDVFQLINDTEIIYGALTNLVPEVSIKDVQEAVKTGAANLYHAAVHSFLYEQNKKQSLTSLFKGTFFILQAYHYLESGQYSCTKNELLQKLSKPDTEILDTCVNRERINSFSYEQIQDAYKTLINWASDKMLT